MAGCLGGVVLGNLLAGLGVLNTVVLHTRERVHDLGVFKAVGMTPRQAIAMVVCWVAGTAPHRYVLPAMAASAGLPASFLNVYNSRAAGRVASSVMYRSGHALGGGVRAAAPAVHYR